MRFELTRTWRRTALLAPTALLTAVGGLILAPPAPSYADVGGHIVFVVPGTTTWTVPAGVTDAIFTLEGGAGGSETTYHGKTTDGGKGGQVRGLLRVTPGQTYTITIGGQGGSVQGFYNSSASGGVGGFGGGGDGGSGDDPGAGGGGASGVALGGTGRFLAAGGGGAVGSSLFDQTSPGGAGGGPSGGDGSIYMAESQYGPARGATQSQGGAVGRDDLATGETQGYIGLGGHGGSADPNDTETNGGGGGGGGLYGGGGGGSSGGAGGSSYLTSDALDSSDTAGVNAGSGYVNIDYGTADTPALQEPTGLRATAGQPFSYQLQTTGWPTPDIVAVGGSLPSWLTLSPDGRLTGMTTKAGVYSFRLAALGPYGETTYDTSVYVYPAATGHLTIDGITPTTTAGTTFAGTAVGHWLDDYGNGISGVSFVALLLSDGPTATFDDGSTSVESVTGPDGSFHIGVVTAGPTPGNLDLAVAYAPFEYTRVHLTITPANALAEFGAGDPPAATVGTPYSFVVPTSGWPTPSLSLIAGTLPPGLTLTADGTLSGNPTVAGNYPITLMAQNNYGNPATRTAIVHVAPVPAPPTPARPAPPRIGSATAGDGTTTVRFTEPPSDGGTPVSGYTVTASPGGRTATGTASPITVTGLRNGTSYTFTVTATNGAGTGPASEPSNAVTPIAPLAISTTNPMPPTTLGARYTDRLTATGGTGPYTWSLNAGSSLPAGLSLHPDGTITGIPTKAQTAHFTAQVADATSPARTATKALTVTIRPAPVQADLAVSVAHLGRFVTGHHGHYRFTVTNTGTGATTGTTTVSITLPRGLTATLARGTGWRCNAHGQTRTCSHNGHLAAHASSSIAVLVRVTARAGRSLTTTATVAPGDATSADNTSTDHVRIRHH